MTNDYDEDDSSTWWLCSQCVKDPYLSKLIVSGSDISECFYCTESGKVMSLGSLAKMVEKAVDDHYELTATEPDPDYLYMMKETGAGWDRDGELIEDVIADIMQVESQPAQEIREILESWHYSSDEEEGLFAESAQYEEKSIDGSDFSDLWMAFEKRLKTENRFAASISNLDDIFGDLLAHQTLSGGSVVVPFGPGTKVTSLYRSRVFQSEASLERALQSPETELGPPPSRLGTHGRMNARGISVFYGAIDSKTAMTEIRPPLGSKLLVGKFEISRELRLIDVGAMKDLVVRDSVFDPKCLEALKRRAFLEKLSDLISRAVMPDDEPFEYLATQAIADYLSSKVDPSFDGLIYKSAQCGDEAINVVLFHKAAKVRLPALPLGTKIDVHVNSYPESYGDFYNIYETVYPSPEETTPKPWYDPSDQPHETEQDYRSDTLVLDRNSLEVHFVERVALTTKPTKVSISRRKSEDVDPF